MNKYRTVRKEVLYTPEEYETVKIIAKEAEYRSVNDYIRTISMKRLIVKFNPEIQKKMLSLMSNLTSNMNQIAIRANENRNIYQIEIEELKEKVDEACRLQVSILSELRKLRQ